MAEPSAYSLSTLLSDLTGCKVSVTQASVPPPTKNKQMFGIYKLVNSDAPIIVQADLALLASMAGVLVGLPDTAVKERLVAPELDELLRDAVHELLNIVSTDVSIEGRAVFLRMTPDPAYVDGAAGLLLRKPGRRHYFTVQVDGYQGGRLAIFSPLLIPVLV